MSNLALWATSTAPRANSRNIGSTAAMVGASHTIAVVMPVSWTICGGMLRCGSTRVANSPSTTPPRTLTAPISVIASATFPSTAVMRPPVVSRSTTTKVVSRSDISAAPSRSGRLSCSAAGAPMAATLITHTDTARVSPRRVATRQRRGPEG